MRIARKFHLGAAVGAALVASTLAPSANAVNVATDGIGEVAIAPYYTTRDGWQTLVNLTNTTQHPLAVKIRVHEAVNSRDVFDITILMSAFDNFTSVILEGSSGPVYRIVDTDTCTAPLGTTQASVGDTLAQRDFPLSNFAYGGGGQSGATREADGGSIDIDRLREGYIEFLVMGHFTNDGNANDVVNLTNDENGDGNPANDSPGELIEAHDCMTLDTQFSSRTNVLTVARFAGEPINALKFNYRLINVGRGVEAGGAALAWANFFNPDVTGVDGATLSGDGPAPDIYGIVPDPNVADTVNANVACIITRGDERSTAVSAPGMTEWNPDDATAAPAPPTSGQGSCQNLITAQTTFDFLEPSLNDAFPVVANGWVDRYNFEMEAANPIGAAIAAEGRTGLTDVFPQQVGNLGAQAVASVRGIDALSLTIQRSSVINEWSDNPTATGTGVETDWIVTMPTKTFYVDQDPGLHVNGGLPDVAGSGQQAGLIPGDRDEAYYTNNPLSDGVRSLDGLEIIDVPYAPFRERFITTSGTDGSAVVSPNPNGSCVGVQFNLYDRMENTITPGGGSIPSPAPPVPGQDICFESNVLSFNDGDVLSSEVRTSVNTGALGPNGWMQLFFNDAVAQAGTGGNFQTGTPTGLLGWSGLPVTGFVVKQRNVGVVTANFASSMDHGFRRECVNGSTGFPGCPNVLDLDP